MKERPLIFTGESVRAILAGRKTQTRRVIKPQPVRDATAWAIYWERANHEGQYGPSAWSLNEHVPPDVLLHSPYGVPGDRLWVRETWCEAAPEHRDVSGVRQAFHRANSAKDRGGEGEAIRQEYIRLGYPYKWKSPMFMPRWASRLLLEVVAVRVERLQSITDADAKAEGASGRLVMFTRWPGREDPGDWTAQEEFESAWEQINGKRHPWSSNPWVWVIEFKRI